MITTPVPTVALLAAARAMTEPEPPADLGLERAVRESQYPLEYPAEYSADVFPSQRVAAAPRNARHSEPPPSSRRPASHRGVQQTRQGELLPSEPFEFELTPRSARNFSAASSSAAPPLAEELGLDHLLADFKPRRRGMAWLRAYGVWLVAAALVLWLIITFAASWLPG